MMHRVPACGGQGAAAKIGSGLKSSRRWGQHLRAPKVKNHQNFATGEETPMFMRRTPAHIMKNAVQWSSIVDSQREKHMTELNHSKWRERFVQLHMYSAKISQENWGEGRHEMEDDEPCFKQKPLGHPNWFMADRIWPVAMLQRNVIYISVFVEKLTLVLIPGSPLNGVAEEVRDQCLVPLAYWNPKTEVRPFQVPGLPVPAPADVVPYWTLSFVDGTKLVLPFPKNCENKYDVINDLQVNLAKADKVDRTMWMESVSHAPDKNTWIRVKRHNLDDYTLNEHCPLQYV
eukprot:TRINITY_DN20455_c0_g1_i1.p1 TRINITY_DN20455_c0_g1~~TRINITY_DN20455_c0_g1_i1.p1  ORF type:complete len:288 (+),score=62.11 TRINITY_DN20455_c0_g1_i1:69-932(+)